jgi:hypothetical protein
MNTVHQFVGSSVHRFLGIRYLVIPAPPEPSAKRTEELKNRITEEQSF